MTRAHRGAVSLTAMSDATLASHAQLLVYRFGPEARFEGQVGGAFQRIESGGALRILDALFVASDPADGELLALTLKGDGAGSIVASLLDFRLDPAARRRATAKALAGGAAGIAPETLRELGRSLKPGEALVALLVAHVWAEVLEDAVGRIGGSQIVSAFAGATSLGELGGVLTAAVATRPESS